MSNRIQNDVSAEFNSMIAGYREMKNELMGTTQAEVESILAPAFDAVKQLLIEQKAVKELTLVSFYIPQLSKEGRVDDALATLKEGRRKLHTELDNGDIDSTIALIELDLAIAKLTRHMIYDGVLTE